jgi:hypothetical protein
VVSLSARPPAQTAAEGEEAEELMYLLAPVLPPEAAAEELYRL